jgi:large subunit ribosomal protein L25
MVERSPDAVTAAETAVSGAHPRNKMDTNLEANLRSDAGRKGGARKLRASGRVPGVVYGGGSEATRIDVDPKAFSDLFEKTKSRNTIVQLSVGGKSMPCIVREVQRNPLTREVLHIDFLQLSEGRMVDVVVPVNPVGRPKGALLGGRLRVVRRVLKARCRYDRIP